MKVMVECTDKNQDCYNNAAVPCIINGKVCKYLELWIVK